MATLRYSSQWVSYNRSCAARVGITALQRRPVVGCYGAGLPAGGLEQLLVCSAQAPPCKVSGAADSRCAAEGRAGPHQSDDLSVIQGSLTKTETMGTAQLAPL